MALVREVEVGCGDEGEIGPVRDLSEGVRGDVDAVGEDGRVVGGEAGVAGLARGGREGVGAVLDEVAVEADLHVGEQIVA